MSPREWSELVSRYQHLSEEWKRARGSAEARNRCAAEVAKLIAKAASRVPSRGDVARSIVSALSLSALESPEHELAVRALLHRKQFPRCFLAPAIAAAVRHGTRGHDIVDAATRAYGARVVLHELTKVAETGALDRSLADLYVYYMGALDRLDPAALDVLIAAVDGKVRA